MYCSDSDVLANRCTNQDRFHFNLDKISAPTPRPITLHLTNTNPLPIIITLLDHTHPVCVCLEEMLRTIPRSTMVSTLRIRLSFDFSTIWIRNELCLTFNITSTYILNNFYFIVYTNILLFHFF